MAIDIDKLKESDKGRGVVYDNGYDREFGAISSWNDTYIHVVYDGRKHSQATKPTDLDFTND